jgi:hypothetical protein
VQATEEPFSTPLVANDEMVGQRVKGAVYRRLETTTRPAPAMGSFLGKLEGVAI